MPTVHVEQGLIKWNVFTRTYEIKNISDNLYIIFLELKLKWNKCFFCG
jgi:hypothetical protein